ncbi:hypothetical protein Trydic_g22067, partial [Trypoxylus dichotomus]
FWYLNKYNGVSQFWGLFPKEGQYKRPTCQNNLVLSRCSKSKEGYFWICIAKGQSSQILSWRPGKYVLPKCS